MAASTPVFDRRIFWDVDQDKMDLDAKWRFVIERVFSWGDVEDIRYCRRYYGDERAFEALRFAQELPYDTLYLMSAIFDQPVERFVAFAGWSGCNTQKARWACMLTREAIHLGRPWPAANEICDRIARFSVDQ
jgi:hypothetical protein